MSAQIDRVSSSPFKTILNFRDLGSTVNTLAEQNILQTSRLFRTGEPDFASPPERDALSSEYRVKSVIDLRSKTEHIEAAKKLAANPPPSPGVVPQSTQDTAKPLELQKPTTHAISLTGSSFERALLWRLSWPSMGKLVYRMAVGRRIEGINVLGTEVMAPRGLLGLGQDTLSASKSEVKQVFTILANPESYPIMFHCTQGKDRTGLVAILLLLLCGVDPSVIEADYRASERELQSQRAERVRQMKNIGLGEEFASCPAGFVDGIVQYLNDGWGGCEGYLQSVGVHERMREAVKQQIMVQA